jgi:hypothetical protein
LRGGLQVQERLTRQIADAIQEAIAPQGVGVVIEARHLCMMMRGIEKQHSSTVTSAMVGCFRQKETRRSSCRWCGSRDGRAVRQAARSTTVVEVNGLLVIDKPGGMTSHDVVGRLRKITGERSIGHLGTLDPMATGVLPLLLGKFTRLAQYFSSAEKSYTGAIRFGFATDTYDAEGEAPGPDCGRRPLTLEQVRARRPAVPRRDGADAAAFLRKEDCRQAGLQAGPRGQAGGTEGRHSPYCQL